MDNIHFNCARHPMQPSLFWIIWIFKCSGKAASENICLFWMEIIYLKIGMVKLFHRMGICARPTRAFWASEAIFWPRFFDLYIFFLWDSLALEDVHVLQDPTWRKKTLRRRFLRVFLGMSTYSLPLQECNHATQNYVIEKHQLNFDFETRDVWCWVLNRFFPNPKFKVWIITIEAFDSQRPGVLKTKQMTSVYLNPVAGLHWRMDRN